VTNVVVAGDGEAFAETRLDVCEPDSDRAT